MKKLRNLLVGALLTLPVMTLNAGTIADFVGGAEMRPTPSVADCCYVFSVGRWWCVPC